MRNSITILEYLQFDVPTIEQEKALLKLATFVIESNSDDFFILSGAAGTGKTSITTALIGLLNHENVNYKIAAPTGRAARILGRKAKTLNSTIHSLIYNAIANPETGEVTFELKDNTVSDFTIFIIDEASMISSLTINDKNSLFRCKNPLLTDLISFVKSGNEKNKVVFLGDRNQLPPINEKHPKALYPVYLRTKYNIRGTISILTEVKRQKDGTEILKNAFLLAKEIETEGTNFNLQGFKKVHLRNAADAYLKDYRQSGHENTISIGATHNMNKMFNSVIRSGLYGNNVHTIELDDLLIITRSWKRNGFTLFSGDHVVVKEIDDNRIEEVALLHFVPIKLISKNLEGFNEIIEDYILLEAVVQPEGLSMKQENRLRHERYAKNKVYRESGNPADDRYVGAIRATYGHSITCNKAQGGEWDKVYLNTFFMPTLRFQYTAITRAKKELVLF